MKRMSQSEIDAMQDEHIRRMGEPEPYRSLRLQLERIKAEEERRQEREDYNRKAEQLRKEIRERGYDPCA
jgi:hypothetical protein